MRLEDHVDEPVARLAAVEDDLPPLQAFHRGRGLRRPERRTHAGQLPAGESWVPEGSHDGTHGIVELYLPAKAVVDDETGRSLDGANVGRQYERQAHPFI